MKFILFLMFFVAPPAEPKNKVWSLQSTSTMEFDTFDACDTAIQDKIFPSVKSTDTVGVFGWCFQKDFSRPAEAQTQATKRLKGGSSYYQWPPASQR